MKVSKGGDAREKGIQHSLSGQQRVIGRQLLCDGSDLSDGPHLDHGELLLQPLELQLHHHVLGQRRRALTQTSDSGELSIRGGGKTTHVDVVVSRRSHVGHRASVPGRQHDLVLDEGVLAHYAVDVSSCDVAANLIGIQKKNNDIYPICILSLHFQV